MAPYNVVIPDIKLFYRRLAGRIDDLKVITFDNFIFNPLEVPEWMDPRDFIFLFSKVFAADNLLGVPSEGILIDALWKLFRGRGIFEGSQNYPIMSELLKLVTNLQNDKVLGLRYRDIYETLLNRLRPYAFLEENFGTRRAIRHEVFTTENVVLEMPPDKVSNYMYNFLISFIINLTYVRNMTQGLRGDDLRTLYLIDEARTTLKASREHTGLEWIEPSINEPITKGREFGLAIWMCSQEMASFSRVYRSNTLTKICFPLTDGEDVSEVKRSFSLSDEQANYLFQLPRQRVAICNYGDFPRSFLLVVEELKGMEKTYTDHEIKEAMADFYNEILPKKDAEQIEITETLPPKFTYSAPEIDALIMLRHLAKNPFMNFRDLLRELKLTPARGDKAREWMVNSGLVKIWSITLKRGKPGEHYELTEEGYKKFGGKPPVGKGSFEHKCFCHAIKEFLEDQGFGVRLEGIMEGSEKAFDVLAWKKGEGMLDYEVTLHFGNLIRNLQEALKTTVKKVVVVVKNKDELGKAQGIVRNQMGLQNRVEFKTIFEFTQKTKDAS